MENYLVLNGKRIDLADEQIKTLGFEVKEDCFKIDGSFSFYLIGQDGKAYRYDEEYFLSDKELFKVANLLYE